jgi:uncharacterized membrane protein
MVPKWRLAALLLTAQALIFGCQMWLVAQIFIHSDQPYILAGYIPCMSTSPLDSTCTY